ncbi:MAG: YfiR family protein [Chitinophagaceae bacterium]|nr:YfiR family protein [Chitinophagaceae bacterium]
MSMDRNFERFGDTVKIGVSSDAMLSELASQSELQIKEKPFVAVKMDSPEDIEEYKIVYIDRNWQEDYGLVARKAEENKALIFAADENYVTTGGGSICFKTFDAKPKIVINLQNVKKQGSDFPANFLKITTVVGLIE